MASIVMSHQESQLDLSQLAVDRSQPKKPSTRINRRWFSRYVLPLSILLGFLSLFGWAARDSFLPAQSVTITPVIVSRAEIKQEGTPLFQAAGWIEPRPTPAMASALAEGVVKEMLVVEGQHVQLGEPVATLIDTDAKLALAEAQAAHQLQQAEVSRAKAYLTAAETNLAQPMELEASLADAAAKQNEVEVALSNLPYLTETAQASLILAKENAQRKELAGKAISGRALRESRAQLTAAENTVAELLARKPKLTAQVDSLRKKRDALQEQLRLLTNETRAVAEAKANLAAARARLAQTQLGVEVAELRLDRMVVRSPIDGCVLSLNARPGQWLSGAGAPSPQGASAVVGLYDPDCLQVRVDVRLEDVPQVQIGQPTQIETAALSSPIAGEVISVTTFADIQKNTLQVKVAVLDPPPVLKPEMLGKVTFLAPPTPRAEQDAGDSPLRLFVPQSLILSGEQGRSLWVADLSTGVAQQKNVTIGPGATDGGLVEVVQGLQPTDKLIVSGRESVTSGARIRVTGEAQTLGSGTSSSRPVVGAAQSVAVDQ